MRIVGGAWRGQSLTPVGAAGDAGAALRPTADRVRESLFNILAHRPEGDPVAGARVLDLFAGTGALGLEALSRGAAAATFVDSGKVALGLIRANVAKLRAGDRATVLAADATRLGPAPESFDLIFLDPPYQRDLGGRDLGAAALLAARTGGWIARGATVVWEDALPHRPLEGFAVADRRTYGSTTISILRGSS